MKRIIYLDNNATTPVDPRVVDEMVPVLREHWGNPASRTHTKGWYAAELVEVARERVAAMLGAESGEIFFTSGGTESIATVLEGITEAAARPGQMPRLVTVATEHRATLDTAQALEKKGVEVRVLPVRQDGLLDLAEVESALAARPLLLSVMAVNNETGVIQDIASLFQLARQHGVLTHCDAVQAVGKIPFDVTRINAHFVSISAHKFYGPKGVGALWVQAGAPRPEPLLRGGGQESGLRAGTVNVPGIVGMGKAAELVTAESKRDMEHLRSLTGVLESALKDYGGVQFNGAPEQRAPGTVNISIEGVPADRLLPRLSSAVALSNSSACSSIEGKASHVIQAMALDETRARGAFRISCGRFTSEEDLGEALQKILSAASAVRGY